MVGYEGNLFPVIDAYKVGHRCSRSINSFVVNVQEKDELLALSLSHIFLSVIFGKAEATLPSI